MRQLQAEWTDADLEGSITPEKDGGKGIRRQSTASW
jgi:hypothetical protein